MIFCGRCGSTWKHYSKAHGLHDASKAYHTLDTGLLPGYLARRNRSEGKLHHRQPIFCEYDALIVG